MVDEDFVENENIKLVTSDNLHKTLDKSTLEIVEQIVNEQDVNQIKDLTNLFNLNQQKKNIVRLVQLNDLMDKVNEEALDRIENSKYDISTKELLDFMKIVQNNIEVSQKNVTEATNQPMIQINQQNNFDLGLSEESKNKILNTVNAILNLSTDDNVIEADIEEIDEEN